LPEQVLVCAATVLDFDRYVDCDCLRQVSIRRLGWRVQRYRTDVHPDHGRGEERDGDVREAEEEVAPLGLAWPIAMKVLELSSGRPICADLT
jgi:hypothetical protein